MELPEVHRLFRYWANHPPIPVVLRAVNGVKSVARKPSSEADVRALMAAMAG